MTPRENLLALYRREPFEYIPVEMAMTPFVREAFQKRIMNEDYPKDYFDGPTRGIDYKLDYDPEVYRKFYPEGLKEGTTIDVWGVAHEPGSAAAAHMTYMRNPMKYMETLEEMKEYPFPDFSKMDIARIKEKVEKIQTKGYAAAALAAMTVWETSWYIRGMENLMADMLCEPELATFVFDKVTEQAIYKVSAYAKAGVDIIYLGDDIGMQHGPMMNLELYRQWIKPRLKAVIDAIRGIDPKIIIIYHSCGTVTEFIPDLIECGIDVLDPVQPECMDFQELYEQYGGKITFRGTIGTQTTMPFGTPEEVKAVLKRNMDIAKKYGGLHPMPTHDLEPEVPVDNIIAYAEACHEYKV